MHKIFFSAFPAFLDIDSFFPFHASVLRLLASIIALLRELIKCRFGVSWPFSGLNVAGLLTVDTCQEYLIANIHTVEFSLGKTNT